MPPLLQIQNLCFAYSHDRQILSNLSLSLSAGERILVEGENGTGKTTLFRCITGLEKFSKGKLFLEGMNISHEKDFIFLRRQVGYILQNSEDQLFFPVVINDVSFGPLNLGLDKDMAEKKAMEILEKMNISYLAYSNSYLVSGGEQKLIAIASILAMEPRILILDEPFNGLDKNRRSHLLAILNNMECAMIMVSHSLDAPRILHMKRYVLHEGQLMEK